LVPVTGILAGCSMLAGAQAQVAADLVRSSEEAVEDEPLDAALALASQVLSFWEARWRLVSLSLQLTTIQAFRPGCCSDDVP